MIIQGKTLDQGTAHVHKSINSNLQDKDLFKSKTDDTASSNIEISPPVQMQDCLYIYKNSSYVALSSIILAEDIIYNDIELTSISDELDTHLTSQINKINEYLNNNKDELCKLLIDYNYAGWGAIEYIWNNTKFKLQQIPIHTCSIIKIQIKNKEYYLLRQKINSTICYFKIMGEVYPDDFHFYQNQKLGNVALLGGDNIYQFFSLPRWVQSYEEILTEINIKKSDYRTVANGNISSGILNINLEPQMGSPIQYDEKGKPIPTQSREEIISDELKSVTGGTAVIFTESNRPVNLDYVSLTNNNQPYLSQLKNECKQSVLNEYNIPLARLMINTEKESMNSNKTQSIWEIYTLNLQNKQIPVKTLIKELLYELYNIDLNVNISTPIFSDRREIEIELLSKLWNDGALTLKQYITVLSEYISVIDLNEYDFNKRPDIWEYRKLPELNAEMSDDDLALIEEIEAQL